LISSGYFGHEHAEERAAGRGVHVATRSVRFAMVIRRDADVLEEVA
jgi:hypothetical protein